MTDDSPRERLPGWLVLGCGAVLTLGLPVWLLFTAVIIQLSPELSGFDVVFEGIGNEAREVPVVWVWLIGGLRALFVMLLATPGVLLVLFTAWTVGSGLRRRSRADRDRYDKMVDGAAVLRDTGWGDRDPVPDPGGDMAPMEESVIEP